MYNVNCLSLILWSHLHEALIQLICCMYVVMAENADITLTEIAEEVLVPSCSSKMFVN